MITLREDLKKVQILDNGLEKDVHYIERVGTTFVYSYISPGGKGVAHMLKEGELDKFIIELYSGYTEHIRSKGLEITTDAVSDTLLIKELLNV